MKHLLLLLLLFSLPLLARTFKMAGRDVDFEEREGLLLHGCEKECLALREIKRHSTIDLKKIREGLKKANSPASDACTRVYGGKSLLGLAPNRDQRAFCVFRDKSMVELNSLGNYLLEKKVLLP